MRAAEVESSQVPERGLSAPMDHGAVKHPGWSVGRVALYGVQLICLAMFFGGGVIYSVLGTPLRWVLGERRGAAVGQVVLAGAFRMLLGGLQRVGLFEIRYEGFDGLEGVRGEIIAANHPGLMDAVFLIARLPRPVCIMRASLMRNPAFFGAAWLAGYIPNDSGPSLIRRCREKLAEGRNLLIFPEGTRTRMGAVGVNRFKNGFVLVSVLTGAPVRTVLIERSGRYFAKETGLLVPAELPVRMVIRSGEIFVPGEGESAKDFSQRLEGYFRARLTAAREGEL